MNNLKLEDLISFCKRRSFVFQSSEIYGGFAAVYDYGHYGTLLKNKIKELWWNEMVLNREDIFGLDSAIYMHPKTWEASGHVTGFDDPQMDCRNCKNRIRADHFLEQFGIDADKWSIEQINEALEKYRKEDKLKCSDCGSNDITKAKRFNLLVKSNLGSPTQEITDENISYLRGETCQGI